MRPERWLDALFTSASKVRILRLLAADPHRSWTEREVAAAVAMSPSSVHLAFQALRDAHIVRTLNVGRTHVVQLRHGLRVASTLRAIFRLERELGDEVLRAIRAAVPKGTACYLYGSTARGTAAPGSDVDVFIVAPTQAKADEVAARVAEAASSVMPVPLQIIALGRAAARRRRRSPLLQAVLREGRPLAPTRMEDLL